MKAPLMVVRYSKADFPGYVVGGIVSNLEELFYGLCDDLGFETDDILVYKRAVIAVIEEEDEETENKVWPFLAITFISELIEFNDDEDYIEQDIIADSMYNYLLGFCRGKPGLFPRDILSFKVGNFYKEFYEYSVP